MSFNNNTKNYAEFFKYDSIEVVQFSTFQALGQWRRTKSRCGTSGLVADSARRPPAFSSDRPHLLRACNRLRKLIRVYFFDQWVIQLITNKRVCLRENNFQLYNALTIISTRLLVSMLSAWVAKIGPLWEDQSECSFDYWQVCHVIKNAIMYDRFFTQSRIGLKSYFITAWNIKAVFNTH